MRYETALWSGNPGFEIVVKSFDDVPDVIIPGEWIRRKPRDLTDYRISSSIETDGYYLRFNGDPDFDFPAPVGLKVHDRRQ